MVGNGVNCINTCKIQNLENIRAVHASGEEFTKNGTTILPGETLRYVCNSGFIPENTVDSLKVLTCGDDGEFEPKTALKCVDVDECLENESMEDQSTEKISNNK
jgi:hypothetical protein